MTRVRAVTFSERDLGIDPLDDPQLEAIFLRVFERLNPVMLEIAAALRTGLTLADNLRCDVVSGKFTHGVAQTVALHVLSNARSAIPLGADSQLVTGITVQPVASRGAPQASVTVYFANTAASRVACSFALLDVGQPSGAVAPSPSLGSPGAIKRAKLSGTVDGANKVFTVAAYTTLYAVLVSGVLLTETTTGEGDYTASGAGGTTITFTKAPRKQPYAIYAP
ncbi:MAG: hypothetical protein ACYC9X_00715 [Dehalococcoidia bacterium]